MLACMKSIFLNVIDPFKSLVVNLCTARFKTKEFYVIFTECVCVCVCVCVYGSQDKQQLLLYTTLPNCILYDAKSVCLLRGTNRDFKNSSCLISSLHS